MAEELSTLEASKSSASRVEFKERAECRQHRRGLDKKLKYAGSGCVGLVGLVLLGVFLFEFKERRVYTQQDVARGLGMRIVGTLPYRR